MVKVCRYQRDNQNPYIEEEQTTQWSKFEDTKGIIRICILKKNRQHNGQSFYLFGIFKLWPLCCLFFFDIWILNTPLVSSNFDHCFVFFFNIRILITSLDQRGNQNPYFKEEQITQWSKFEDTKKVIRISVSKKNRQHNGQSLKISKG
jgi:hypothetical protein